MIKELTLAGIMTFVTPLNPLVTGPTETLVNSRSVECLALNVYHEARNQGSAGLLAVSAVVLNRVKDPRFPNTICEVIEQGPTRESWKTRQTPDPNDAKFYPIRHRCQFSWYCDGKSDEIPSFDGDIFQLIYEYAELYLRPDVILIDITDGATHYHADYVYPEWRKSKTKTVEIGDHIFYRWEK